MFALVLACLANNAHSDKPLETSYFCDNFPRKKNPPNYFSQKRTHGNFLHLTGTLSYRLALKVKMAFSGHILRQANFSELRLC